MADAGASGRIVIAVFAADNFAGWYRPWALISLLGLVLGGLGVVFGVAHLVWGRRRTRPSPAR